MLRNTLSSFFKIGLIGFGGGSALIPVTEAEVVNNHPYLTSRDFTEHTIVSNITPGALPVKLGALCGDQMAGISGCFAGAYSVALPGAIGTIIILSLLSVLGTGVVQTIEYASIGVSVFIILLLINYIRRVMNEAKAGGRFTIAAFVVMITAFLSGGKEIRALAALVTGTPQQMPIFDLATIDLLLLTFSFLFITDGKYHYKRLIPAIAVTVLGILISGKSPIVSFPDHRWILIAFFLLGALVTIIDARKANAQLNNSVSVYPYIKRTIVFAIIPCALALVALPLAPGAADYALNGMVSTITSFGGGEAYLTIADGMFVETGIITPAEFYGQLVPIANALPGPILVKVLSGTGFLIGVQENGQFAGYIMSIWGFTIALGVTCISCFWVQYIYKRFSNLSVFSELKKWILPVVCGLLLSVICSMLTEALKVCHGADIPLLHSAVFIFLLFLLITVLIKKTKMADVSLVLFSGCVSILFIYLLYPTFLQAG